MTPLARSVADRANAAFVGKRLPGAIGSRRLLVPAVPLRGRVRLRAACRAVELYAELGTIARCAVLGGAATIILAFVAFSVYAWSTLL
jgi:hypothetical protein